MHGRIRRHLVQLSLTLLVTLNACAARRSLPLGTIPAPQPLVSDTVKATKYAVDQHVSDYGYTLVKNPKLIRRVENVIAKLSRAASGGVVYPSYVVDAGDESNAMAVNGNTIVVYKGLLDRFTTDQRLAVVLGHEIAHILCQHHADTGAEGRSQAVEVGSSLLGAAASIGASIAGLGSSTAELAGDVTQGVTGVVGTGAFVRSYDRAMEREADQVGLMIMAKAGYDPHEAIYVWENAQELLGTSNSFSFLSTHPSSRDRVEELKEALPVALQYFSAKSTAGRTR